MGKVDLELLIDVQGVQCTNGVEDDRAERIVVFITGESLKGVQQTMQVRGGGRSL